jgi:hypothetical protein
MDTPCVGRVKGKRTTEGEICTITSPWMPLEFARALLVSWRESLPEYEFAVEEGDDKQFGVLVVPPFSALVAR